MQIMMDHSSQCVVKRFVEIGTLVSKKILKVFTICIWHCCLYNFSFPLPTGAAHEAWFCLTKRFQVRVFENGGRRMEDAYTT